MSAGEYIAQLKVFLKNKYFRLLKSPFSKMMNNIVRSALRVSSMRSFTPLGRRDFARTFWHMSKPEIIPGASQITLKKPSLACNCGCGLHHLHTKGIFNVLSSNESHRNYSNITKQFCAILHWGCREQLID